MIVAALASWAIPLAALVISGGALLYSVLTLREKSESDLTTHLYQRIKDLEDESERCRDRCSDLERKISDVQDENFRLMRRLLKVENGTS